MKNDNRNYNYSADSKIVRHEFAQIIDWIPPKSRVIDLGCGDGELLKLLKEKNVKSVGLDASEAGVLAARKKGLQVQEGRIDTRLHYSDKEFDYAICNVTLQMVVYPEVLLSEMKRIAKRQIVSFPNFAFILNRLDLLFLGRMPRVMIPGYSWYDTGHLHQLSLSDFEKFADANKIKIKAASFHFPPQLFFIPLFIKNIFANLLATSGIYLLSG